VSPNRPPRAQERAQEITLSRTKLENAAACSSRALANLVCSTRSFECRIAWDIGALHAFVLAGRLRWRACSRCRNQLSKRKRGKHEETFEASVVRNRRTGPDRVRLGCGHGFTGRHGRADRPRDGNLQHFLVSRGRAVQHTLRQLLEPVHHDVMKTVVAGRIGGRQLSGGQ